MKQKIIDALKTKYANLGLGPKALDGVASWLIASKTVTKEEEISTAIEGEIVVNLMKSFQAESDSLRTEKQSAMTAKEAAEKALNDYKAAHPDKKPGDPKPEDPNATRLAELEKWKADMEKKSKEDEDKKTREAVVASLEKLLKEKGCENDFIRNMTLKGISIAEGATAESLVEQYKAEYDKNFKEAYGDGFVPPAGNRKVSEYAPGGYASEVDRLRAEGKLPPKKQ